MSEHYFTARPASDAETRPLTLMLGGREVGVRVAGGVFSPGGLDKGTAVLLDRAPQPPASGRFLDLGCGWGPIALDLALRSPAARVLAVDVNERALDLTRRNAAALGLTGVTASLPGAVDPGRTYDLIRSNPPIRVGKAVLHDLLRTWLPRLAPGGRAELVVQRNLGSDSLQVWLDGALPDLRTERTASAKGFRVLTVTRPDP